MNDNTKLNILVLTSIYPQKDDKKGSGVTPVVEYFCKEWVKKGHKVIVIHNNNTYPLFVYLLPGKIKELINSKLAVVIPEFKQRKKLISTVNDVKCYRLPMCKIIPKGGFSGYQINKQFSTIKRILKNEEFSPDIVLGHWENPQIPLISKLKKSYKCRSAVVFHGVNYINKKFCSDWNEKYISNIDKIGCRCKSMVKDVAKFINLKEEAFICYSGIPDKYVKENICDKRNIMIPTMVHKYLYVGRLIKRKNVDVIIKALNLAYPEKDFLLNIVGQGAMKDELMSLVSKLGLQKNINFINNIPREDVIKLMKNSDCFTMVSKDEVFGLVYLEAMCCGCIVIASKDEGIDGVILNEHNGFLSKSGDVEELASIYRKIKILSNDKKKEISRNAVNTVQEFTDSKVAKRYLENIIK